MAQHIILRFGTQLTSSTTHKVDSTYKFVSVARLKTSVGKFIKLLLLKFLHIKGFSQKHSSFSLLPQFVSPMACYQCKTGQRNVKNDTALHVELESALYKPPDVADRD